jgi:hypothetical protein
LGEVNQREFGLNAGGMAEFRRFSKLARPLQHEWHRRMGRRRIEKGNSR